MSSENRFFSYSSPSRANIQEDFSSNLEPRFELEEDTRDIDHHSSGDSMDFTTFMMKSQIFTSPKVIDMVSDNDIPPKIPFHQNEQIQMHVELVYEPEENEPMHEEPNNIPFHQNEHIQMHEELNNVLVYEPIQPNLMTFEELPTETHRQYPSITRKDIQKAPFNFGKTAIGTYMMKLIIKKGRYDKFLRVTLQKDENFIETFKEFCKTVNYKTRKDFKFVWGTFGDFQLSNNVPYNHYVALKKITKRFLETDVASWIETRIKRRDYKPIYQRCVEVYLQGIDDLDRFDFSWF